jgi:hypothetical protein
MAANEEVRREVIAKALAGLSADHETLRVKWRGKTERLPVVRIPLAVTVLNPKSHRIKSQLESMPSANEAIEEDPDGEVAQSEIADLLRQTYGFAELKQNLADEEQRDPGIITRQGRLINANTRAVALTDLGKEFIDVAVLPEDASLGEIYDLELDLQVAQDYRQEYSFTNELLFVDDLITGQSRNEEEVALRLRWATPTKQSSLKKGSERVRRYVRHLALIREIQAMSGGKLPLTDFDDAEQTLQEFDKAYESLRDKDPAAADRLKQARTLGLLVDLGYSRQRSVDSAWVEDHFAEALREDSILREVSDAVMPDSAAGDDGAAASSDDLTVFETGEESNGAATVHDVVELFATRLSQSAQEDVVTLPTPKGEKDFGRDAISSAIYAAMDTAVAEAKRIAKAGTEIDRPITFASEAASRLVKARQAYEVIADREDFDAGVLRDAIEKVERAVDALNQSVGA